MNFRTLCPLEGHQDRDCRDVQKSGSQGEAWWGPVPHSSYILSRDQGALDGDFGGHGDGGHGEKLVDYVHIFDISCATFFRPCRFRDSDVDGMMT